ncbi:MAG TPA: hypothetical protein VIL74_24615 [Pyrinomonadaceae bacterium]|jgi:hypothetical protein
MQRSAVARRFLSVYIIVRKKVFTVKLLRPLGQDSFPLFRQVNYSPRRRRFALHNLQTILTKKHVFTLLLINLARAHSGLDHERRDAAQRDGFEL